MTAHAADQYHFSQEQRIRLGQVYNLILSWRQERLAAQSKQIEQSESAPCPVPPDVDYPPTEDDTEARAH